MTPTDQPTPGLWDPAGALTLPGLVEPHAHLDKTFTIERCRPAQAGLLAAIHAMHEDRQHWTRADIQRRASAALAGGSKWCDPFTQPYRLVYRRRTGRLAGDRPPRYRRHHLERVALVPLTLFRDPAQAEAIARTVATSGEGCLLGGFIHSSNWDAAAMANLLDSAARWELDLDLHIDEELSEVSQGLTRWRTISPATLFPGISAAATAARWPLAATNRRRRSCASWRRTASPLSLCR